jgi:hypothetical protein
MVRWVYDLLAIVLVVVGRARYVLVVRGNARDGRHCSGDNAMKGIVIICLLLLGGVCQAIELEVSTVVNGIGHAELVGPGNYTMSGDGVQRLNMTWNLSVESWL